MDGIRYLIRCEKETDRDTLTVILARNDYTVRRTKRKEGTSNRYTYYIEYWDERKPVKVQNG